MPGTTTYVAVDTHQYESAHARSPRGAGDWAFTVEGGSSSGETQFFNGTYAAARADAVAWAREVGAYRVVVGS